MEKIGFVFPGQGSQRVGMGQDLARAYPSLTAAYYEPAEEILGLPLRQFSWEGPAEHLRDTSVTQPAIYLASVCVTAALREGGLDPEVVAGHSLGEYPALVSAGILEWRDGLRLVRLRGQLMAEVNERVPGAMAAVVGLHLADVERLCARAADRTGQVVQVANDNEPRQVVISGQLEPVREVMAMASHSGARKVVPLDVGAPFHCDLMAEIEDRFAAALAEVHFREPRCEFISSVTAQPLRSAAEVTLTLRRQLTARVRWRETIRCMAASGVRHFIEAGPGKVLAGLCRRTIPDAAIYTTTSAQECAAVVGEMAPSPNLPMTGTR